jgi:hypothetical protein
MSSASEIRLLTDDLAAHWTDAALEVLKVAGIDEVSVAMELETWRTLKQVLLRELRWQRVFRFSTTVSLRTLMEQVLRQGALLVAKQFEPEAVTHEFARRIRRAAGDRQATEAERRLYARIVRRPSLHGAFRPPTRSEFTPRLHVSALGA